MCPTLISAAVLFSILSLLTVVEGGQSATRNETLQLPLPLNERYRRLIPYMTFYLHQDKHNNYKQTQPDNNNLQHSRYEGFKQGYNYGFVHNNPQRGFLSYQQVPQISNYYLHNHQGQAQSFLKTIAQDYLSPKSGLPERAQYVQQPRLPHPPKLIGGFKPMDPNAITITQSQELPLQASTQRPYENNSPRPFLLAAQHNSLRTFSEQESRRPYTEKESQRPLVESEPEGTYVDSESQRPYVQVEHQRPSYIEHKVQTQYAQQESQRPYVDKNSQRPFVTQVPQSPGPFVVTVQPNSQPHHHPQTEQSSDSPFVQFVTTLKPQFYTSVSNHIYPTPSSSDYKNEEELNGYDISRVLPSRITSDNLESSIKTLSTLLQILQKANALPQSPKKLTKVKVVHPTVIKYPVKVSKPLKQQQLVEHFDDEGSTPGKPGVDYPAYTKIPQTSFSCKEQRYKGFFGDPETNCQVWHYCDLNGGQASFLCPNGTIFSQVALTCDWWFNVKCASTPQLYVLNERLYKYIIPQKPSFPEDFTGPLVDRYLEQKYRELEEKKGKKNSTATDDNNDDQTEHSQPHETNQARAIIY